MRQANDRTLLKKSALLSPQSLILIFGILVGMLFCVIIPYGAGFDEETHLVRIVDISGLHFVPNRSGVEQTYTFVEFFSLSYQRRAFHTPANDLFESVNFLKKPDFQNMADVETRSIYSPVIFLPQAFLAGLLLRFLDAPVIPSVILMRVLGLLLYIGAAWLTVKLLPLGKWVFAVLALSPMALFQAATLNADGFTNAVSFLFIGLTLKVYADQQAPIPLKQAGALAGLALLLGLAKPGSIVILPLLLLLTRRKFTSEKAVSILWAGVVLAVIVTFAWTALTVQKSHFSAEGGQSLSRQAALVLANPGDFILTFISGALASLGSYFRDWTGIYGYWVGMVPEPVYWFYPLALLAAVLAEPRSTQFSRKDRAYQILIFALASTAIMLMYFITHYAPGDASSLGRQGRYFIPFAPLLLIPLSGWLPDWPKLQKPAPILAAGSLLVTLAFYGFGLWATYYTDCGYSIYAGESCILPIYKNLDKKTPPEIIGAPSTRISQRFTNTCDTSLEAVQVLVKTVPATGSGVVRYSILDSAGQILSTQQIPITEILPMEYLDLKVSSSAFTPGAEYDILLEAQDFPASSGVGFAYRSGNFYSGDLLMNGAPVEGDLVFHYICANPWKK
jgi:uncharacterized membrane protein